MDPKSQYRCSNPNCHDLITYKKYKFLVESDHVNCLECNEGKYEYLDVEFFDTTWKTEEPSILNRNFNKIYDTKTSSKEKVETNLFSFLNYLKLTCFIPLSEFFHSDYKSYSIYNLVLSLERPSMGAYEKIIRELDNKRGMIKYSDISLSLMRFFNELNQISNLPIAIKNNLQKVFSDYPNQDPIENPIQETIKFRNQFAHGLCSIEEIEYFKNISSIIMSYINSKITLMDLKISHDGNSCLLTNKDQDKFISLKPWIFYNEDENVVIFYEKKQDKNTILHTSNSGHLYENLIKPKELYQFIEAKKYIFDLVDQSHFSYHELQRRLNQSWNMIQIEFKNEKEKITNRERPDLENEIKIAVKSRKQILLMTTRVNMDLKYILYNAGLGLHNDGAYILFWDPLIQKKTTSFYDFILNSLNIQINSWTKASLESYIQRIDKKIVIILYNWNELIRNEIEFNELVESFQSLNKSGNLELILELDLFFVQSINFFKILNFKEIFFLDLKTAKPYFIIEEPSLKEMKLLIKKEAQRRKIKITEDLFSSNQSLFRNIKQIEQIPFFFLALSLGYKPTHLRDSSFIGYLWDEFNRRIKTSQFYSNLVRVLSQFCDLVVFQKNSYIPKDFLSQDLDSVIPFLLENGILKERVIENDQVVISFFNRTIEFDFLSCVVFEKSSPKGTMDWIQEVLLNQHPIESSSQFIAYGIDIVTKSTNYSEFKDFFEYIENKYESILVNYLIEINHHEISFFHALEIFSELLSPKSFSSLVIKFVSESIYRNRHIEFENLFFYFLNKYLKRSTNLDLRFGILYQRAQYYLHNKSWRKLSLLLNFLKHNIQNSKNTQWNEKIILLEYMIFKDQGRIEKAIPLIRQLILIQYNLRFQKDSSLIEYILQYSFCLELILKIPEAKKQLLWIKKYKTKRLDPFDLLRADLDNQLAKLYLKSGDYKQAEILFQDVLKIRQVELGDYHPLVSACYTNLAIIEKYNGNYKKAIFYIEKDLQSCIDYFGENHKDTAKSYMNIGIFYSLIGNFPESLKSISKGVAIYESLTDSNDIELPKFYSLLANTYIHNQDFIQARELFTKTLKIIRGKKSYSLVSLLNNFGVTYEREKSFQRAETFYRRAYKASRYLYGPDHIETANILSNISVVLDHLGNHQKALELSEESLRLKSIHFPKEHILILRHRVNVVEFFIHAELIQEANEKLNLLRQDIIRWNVYDKEIMSEMDKLEKEIQNQKEISVDPRKF